jgi:hypothetical protein
MRLNVSAVCLRTPGAHFAAPNELPDARIEAKLRPRLEEDE